jgi:hypothetical protein
LKKLILAGVVALGAIAAVQVTAPEAAAAKPVDCRLVLCAPCPEGTVLAPTPQNCCNCEVR